MNIYNDFTYDSKYCFHIGDLVGNIFYIFKEAGIEEKKVTFELIEKYACILMEKFTKAKIKAEFIISDNETNEFIKYNKGLYKKDNKNIVLTKDLSRYDLIKKYHSSFPYHVYEVITDKELEGKFLEIYEESKNIKVLKKTND